MLICHHSSRPPCSSVWTGGLSAAQVLMACLQCFEAMGYVSDTSFTSLALQQLLASDSSVSVQLTGLALIERTGRLPHADSLQMLESKVIDVLA